MIYGKELNENPFHFHSGSDPLTWPDPLTHAPLQAHLPATSLPCAAHTSGFLPNPPLALLRCASSPRVSRPRRIDTVPTAHRLLATHAIALSTHTFWRQAAHSRTGPTYRCHPPHPPFGRRCAASRVTFEQVTFGQKNHPNRLLLRGCHPRATGQPRWCRPTPGRQSPMSGQPLCRTPLKGAPWPPIWSPRHLFFFLVSHRCRVTTCFSATRRWPSSSSSPCPRVQV
jgi:hypothetical protein